MQIKFCLIFTVKKQCKLWTTVRGKPQTKPTGNTDKFVSKERLQKFNEGYEKRADVR